MGKFSANELLQIALQIEREGEAFYQEAARLTRSPAAKDLFEHLALEEVGHAHAFRQIAAALDVSSEEYEEEEAQRYLRALVDERVFTDPRDAYARAKEGDQGALLRYAIGFEKETILFFNALRDVAREKDQVLIDKLIEEEKKHVRQLSQCLSELD